MIGSKVTEAAMAVSGERLARPEEQSAATAGRNTNKLTPPMNR